MDELRETLEAAFDEEVSSEQTQEQEAQLETEKKDESEEPTQQMEKPNEEANLEAIPSGKTSRPSEEESVPEKPNKENDASSTKAPASWTAKARESWGKLPPEAQAEVFKREKEVDKVLQESAQSRRAVQELNTVLAPHAQRLMAAGIQSPMQAIGTLLQTEGQLRSGDSNTKAQTIATLIKQYGVDIGTLDAVLSNQAPPMAPTGQNSDIDALLNQKLAPYQQFIEQQSAMAQAQQQQSQHQAMEDVAKFSEQAEFINDVRNITADYLDLAAKRGEHLSLQDAYDRACYAHPEVSKIIADRKRQTEVMGRNEAAQAKRQAAVSIQGEQGAQSMQQPTGSLRDTINQAWISQMEG